MGITDDWYVELFAEGIVAMWKVYKELDSGTGDIGTYINFQIRFRLLDLMRKKVRTEETEEKVLAESKVQLENDNRHGASGKSLVVETNIVLEDHEFWEEVKDDLPISSDSPLNMMQ